MNEMSRSRESGRSTRGFWSLFITQFQGAFSDNVLKNLVIFMLLGASVPLAEKHRIGELVGALFTLPFILFSMTGGFFADRFSKRATTVGVKVLEVLIMLFTLYGFVSEQLPILMAGVFLMGVQSALFGPSKYGLLPELLPEKKLSWGNGMLELGTFMAIILGTVTAAFFSEQFRGRHMISGSLLVVLAVVGLGASMGIDRVPAADPGRRYKLNFVGDLFRQLRSMRGDRPLILAVVGNMYFTFLGALVLLNLFFYGASELRVSEMGIGKLNVALALGIGLGSVAAGYLSGGKIEYGLVPLGAIGLGVSSILLSAPGLTLGRSMVWLGLMGFLGGFFIVPISALLQHRPDKARKGEVLAAANLLSFVGAFLASGAHYVLAGGLGLSPRAIFLSCGVLTLAGSVYAVCLLPDALLRFVLWALTRTVYRIRVEGRDNIPEKGGALFVCNHVSLVDALLLLASTDRRVRFMMLRAHYELPYVKPFARILGVIPISSEQRPREMIRSLRTAGDAIRGGGVVCIFAEGQITRIGHLLPFRRGFQKIMKDVVAPIIPVALDGVWGSVFSYERGRFLWKVPRRLPYPVTINYGAAMPHTATPMEVRQRVQELLAEAWRARRSRMRLLHRAFLRTARRHPFRFAMADGQNERVRFGSVLARVIFLGRRLRRLWAGQEKVGILLPPSVAGAVVNLAALFLGKVPVNLNYTISAEAFASCVAQCGIRTILTSRIFLEKVKLALPGAVVFLEDVVPLVAGAGTTRMELEEAEEGVSPGVELASGLAGYSARGAGVVEAWVVALAAWLLPGAWLERWLGNSGGAQLDDLAAVIFSSGSTGDPKGVLLSHYNIGSNVEQIEQVFGLNRRDCMLGALPFFHSFGFTGTIWLPAVLGVGVVYHSNPLDARSIGFLVREYAVTFLLVTPTFLQIYMRGCAPEDFGSLRVVMTGAEKLPERLAGAFEERFGIRPLEGYGCTECAPVVAVNTHDFRSAGFRQVGAKRGKIGHPLPGVTVRVVDPESKLALPSGQAGLLLVRGPNVMRGYLNRPDKTGEALISPASGPGGVGMGIGADSGVGRKAPAGGDCWYVTGDIAVMDEDGFLQITDRVSRFSKIGGEMVPHIRVEEELHELAGATDLTFVVAGVPDEKKGERLVILHRLEDSRLKAVLEKMAGSSLPNLWKPRPDQFYRVDSFPQLGTGKLDLRKVREMALKQSGPQRQTPAEPQTSTL